MAKVTFEHPQMGITKTAPVGFSWTTFFFGCLPALFRGDFKWFLIQAVIQCCTFNFSALVFAFLYNKLYITDLLAKGYKVKTIDGGTLESVKVQLGINLPVM